MAKGVLAKRYAQAVFEIALERKQLDRWQSDLATIASLSGDAEILAYFESPKVPFANKVGLLSQRLVDLNPGALNLTYLLVARGRLSLTPDIADEFERLLNRYRGIEPVEVTTAILISAQDRARLKQRLSALVGKKIVLKTKVNPSLVAGLVVRIGDKLIDGSTRGKLAILKRELEVA